MAKSTDVQAEIRKLNARNSRVEADKAWETSWARRAILAAATYLSVLLFLYIIKAPNPELASIVPAAAYLLQTLTLPFLKDFWLKNLYNK